MTKNKFIWTHKADVWLLPLTTHSESHRWQCEGPVKWRNFLSCSVKKGQGSILAYPNILFLFVIAARNLRLLIYIWPLRYIYVRYNVDPPYPRVCVRRNVHLLWLYLNKWKAKITRSVYILCVAFETVSAWFHSIVWKWVLIFIIF